MAHKLKNFTKFLAIVIDFRRFVLEHTMGAELFEPTKQRIRDLVGFPIVDADVAVGANINADKIGTGVVDNTEFNRLNGITSALEEQGNKGAVSGYAGLDASQELLLANFPAGAALQVLRRNAGNTALEFSTPGAASQTPWITDIDADGFDLTDLSNILFRNSTGVPTSTDRSIHYNDAEGMVFNALTADFFQFEINAVAAYNFNATRADYTTKNIINLGTLNTHTIPGGTSTFALFSDNLSVFGATTSLQFIGVISDETGTGLLVFNDTPTILTPTIASFVNATHSHLNAAGGGTITKASISDTPWAKADLPATAVYTDQANTFGAFAQRFPTTQLQLDNPAGTFQYIFATSAIITTDKTVTLPLLTANDTFVFNAFGATLTNKTITLGGNTITGTKAQFDTALTDDNFAYIGQANIFTQNQRVDARFSVNQAIDSGKQVAITIPDDTALEGIIIQNTDGFIEIGNFIATAGRFRPYIKGSPENAASTMSLISEIVAAQDTGTEPVMQIDGRLDTTAQVATRPIFQFSNFETKLWEIAANGNVDMKGNDLTLGAIGAKLIFTGDTHIEEVGANRMDFVAGGGIQMFIQFASGGGGGVNPGKSFFLDGGGNTLLKQTAADDALWQVGGEQGIRLQEIGTEVNVVFGATNVLALAATDGFQYIPSMAGTPTGTPTAYTGKIAMVYDTSADKIWFYNGAWRGVLVT